MDLLGVERIGDARNGMERSVIVAVTQIPGGDAVAVVASANVAATAAALTLAETAAMGRADDAFG